MGNKSAAVISQSYEASNLTDGFRLSCFLQGSNSFFRRADSFFRQKNSHENQSVHIEQAFVSVKSQTLLSEAFHGFEKALVVSFLVWAMYNDIVGDIVNTLYPSQSGGYLISCWYRSLAELTPNNRCLYLYKPLWVTKVVIWRDS